MDDQQTYLLNGLLNRHFGLGRIVRFREVQRGRQARCFELFTAQEKEYLVQLFPPAFSADGLDFAAGTVNLLDENRFSVMPFVRSKSVVFVGEGPQNQHLLVSFAPVGSAMTAAQYSVHDISQVGLRLAWMHRLLKEQIPPPRPAAAAAPGDYVPLAKRFDAWYAGARAEEAGGGQTPPISEALFGQLNGLLRLATVAGWCHGDIQLAALLHDGDHQLRAIVDWGLLHYGTPLEDVVDAFATLSTDARGNLDRARGRALLESYDSLLSIQRLAWTPVVAVWCAQRLLDQQAGRRQLGEDFANIVANPERLATAMASCSAR